MDVKDRRIAILREAILEIAETPPRREGDGLTYERWLDFCLQRVLRIAILAIQLDEALD